MDKQLINHQIVTMRKTAKEAKHFARQKLLKQISLLKKKVEKLEARQQESKDAKLKDEAGKLQNKLKNKHNLMAKIKTLDQDLISKQALGHDASYFNALISKTDSSSVDHLLALVCSNKHIQQVVKKFKDDNPNCDQWLPELLELWETSKKKRKNKDTKEKAKIKLEKVDADDSNTKSQTLAKSSKPQKQPQSVSKSAVSPKKTPVNNNNSMITTAATTPKSTPAKKALKSSPAGQFQVTTTTTVTIKNQPKIVAKGPAVIKRLDLTNPVTTSKAFDVKVKEESDDEDSELWSEDEEDDEEDDEEQPIVEVNKAKRKDAFFLTKNGDEVSEDDEDEQGDEEQEEKAKSPVADKKNFNGQNKFNGQKKFGNNKKDFGGKQNFGGQKQFGGQNGQRSFGGARGGGFDRNNNTKPQFNGKSPNSGGKKPFQSFPKKDFRGGAGPKGGQGFAQGPPGQTPRPKESGGNMHPSWQAKQAEKNKMQNISFGGSGSNKKIKFE